MFTFSIVVADNDAHRTAQPVVEAFRRGSGIEATYCVQPKQNISMTRNRALEMAHGDFIALIDDDEYPIRNWLLTLYENCVSHQVDGVLGPVKPYYDVDPPAWVVKDKFYDRPTYPTGFVIDWRKGRTGNVLLKREIVDGEDPVFDPTFLSGEDQDFFRRMIEKKGKTFIWCHEAMAYELVPESRWRLSFLVRRALLRGQLSLLHPNFGAWDLAKSTVAVILYSLAMPVLFLVGRHLFISYLVKTCDHLGKILAFLRVLPIQEAYIVD